MPADDRARRRGDASSPARSTPTPSTSRRRSSAAGRHNGSSFVEVLQNCNIFNDGAWRDFTDREVREDRMLVLEHGKPMIFGKDRDKGIRLNGLHPEVVTIGENGVTEADLLVHDETPRTRYLAFMLSRMFWPEFPVPVGVLRAVARPTHDQLIDGPARARRSATARRRRPRAGCSTAARPGRSSRRAAAMTICPGLPLRQPAGRGRLRQLRRGPVARSTSPRTPSTSTAGCSASTSTSSGAGRR